MDAKRSYQRSPRRAGQVPEVRRVSRDRASDYADWIRLHKCAVMEYANSPELVECSCWTWQSEAAHIKHRGMGGCNAPADEGNMIPLCRWHHQEMHGPLGIRGFMALHGLESAPSDYLEKYESEREFAA